MDSSVKSDNRNRCKAVSDYACNQTDDNSVNKTVEISGQDYENESQISGLTCKAETVRIRYLQRR